MSLAIFLSVFVLSVFTVSSIRLLKNFFVLDKTSSVRNLFRFKRYLLQASFVPFIRGAHNGSCKSSRLLSVAYFMYSLHKYMHK